MNKLGLCLMLLPFLFVELPQAMEGRPVSAVVLQEEYALYDRIIEDKFLTAQIQLVLLERMTVSRLVPNQPESMTMAFFQQQGFFNGMLPHKLVRDFLDANQAPSRLDGRFRFGVRYRFVSGETDEDVETRLAIPAMREDGRMVQAPSVLDRLAFSRVGRTLKNDQALVYVENRRRDGTGAGFLVWLRRRDQVWELFDTDVVWTVYDGAAETETP